MRWKLFACVVGTCALGIGVASKAESKKPRRAPKPVRQAAGADHLDDRMIVPDLPRAKAARSGGKTVVYLNGDGATLTPGMDASGRNRSSIVYGRGLDEVTFPQYARGASSWRALTSCVRGEFAAFDVEIVDERPASGDYIMAVVGGGADALGYPGEVAGIAPYSGDLIEDAVVFVFEGSMHGDDRQLCEVAAHEVGHALGLDHEYLCEDPMTYLSGCGQKTFQDADAQCGEWSPRGCESGLATQNTYRHIGATVGFAAEAPREPEVEQEPEPGPEAETGPGAGPGAGPAEPEAEPEPEPEDTDADGYDCDHDADANADADAPTITLLQVASERYESGTILLIAVQVGNAAHVLVDWEHTGQVFDCDHLAADGPVYCEREDDVVVFALRVGSGNRDFTVAAVDADGRSAVTERISLSFE